MSVLIKGMDMPKTCGECAFLVEHVIYPCWCCAGDFAIKPSETDMRDGICPLVEIPTPHGRLIDADALYELIDCGFDIDFDEVPEIKAALLQMIIEQPTVIEAGIEEVREWEE